jgi:hypothetical protein
MRICGQKCQRGRHIDFSKSFDTSAASTCRRQGRERRLVPLVLAPNILAVAVVTQPEDHEARVLMELAVPETCPVSTGRGTRRVHLVRGEGTRSTSAPLRGAASRTQIPEGGAACPARRRPAHPQRRSAPRARSRGWPPGARARPRAHPGAARAWRPRAPAGRGRDESCPLSTGEGRDVSS